MASDEFDKNAPENIAPPPPVKTPGMPEAALPSDAASGIPGYEGGYWHWKTQICHQW